MQPQPLSMQPPLNNKNQTKCFGVFFAILVWSFCKNEQCRKQSSVLLFCCHCFLPLLWLAQPFPSPCQQQAALHAVGEWGGRGKMCSLVSPYCFPLKRSSQIQGTSGSTSESTSGKHFLERHPSCCRGRVLAAALPQGPAPLLNLACLSSWWLWFCSIDSGIFNLAATPDCPRPGLVLPTDCSQCLNSPCTAAWQQPSSRQSTDFIRQIYGN